MSPNSVVAVGHVRFGNALPLAVIAGRAVSRLLYGVSAADPISIALASTVLVLVAALACLIPARAATRVDPLTSLRES